ncbi:MAG: hypothetical protein E3J60_01205 [Dehalococcoidia bacterium]|nr:MAG: hypothetical protein E3J60_01205 [Dehalococcoidia bacterium]
MIKQQDKDGNMVYTYPHCPICKSKKRHFEKMCEKAVKAGTGKPGMIATFQQGSRTFVDRSLEPTLPIGTEVPSIQLNTDICMDCGCVYAVIVVHTKATKTLITENLWKPGDKP